jgi:TatD DNase family protein
MSLIDTHCHLGSHKYELEEIESIIQRAKAAGVEKIVTLTTCLNDVERNLTIGKSYSCVGVCLGIHPCDVHEEADDAVVVIGQYLNEECIVGIGETGLDYYHPAPDGWTEEEFRKRQRDFLEQHFLLAEKFQFNVVIHTRDKEGNQSFEDALTIYQRYAHNVRAVFHCFIGTEENAWRVIKLGGLVSFAGVTTFKSAKHVLKLAAKLPVGTFMVETDAPYLAPVPHRGQRCEPAFVSCTSAMIAAARGEDLTEFASHTTKAANFFFN